MIYLVIVLLNLPVIYSNYLYVRFSSIFTVK